MRRALLRTSFKWTQRSLTAIGLAGVVAIAFMVVDTGPTVASGPSVAPASTGGTIVLGSGTTTSTTGLDPNTSFCAYPSNATSVTTDPGETQCDPNYPANPVVVTTPPWGAPIAGTNWVGIAANGSDLYHATSPCPAGNIPTGLRACNFYVYNATFTLPALCSTKGLSLKGEMMSDNLAGVFLNTNFIKEQPTGAGFSYDGVNPPATNSSVPTSFVDTNVANFIEPGLNTVDFVVWDATFAATGLDYSLTVNVPSSDQCGTLKVCKVAGYGIPVGTPFTFNVTDLANSNVSTVTVPAGPAPGGYCVVVGQELGQVTVQEAVPVGDQVTKIVSNGGGTITLATGTITPVTIHPNLVTEVTYTDSNPQGPKPGYLEICKTVSQEGVAPPASFTFTVNGNNYTVPTGACTSAIEVPSGAVTVTETPVPPFSMATCSTIPASALVSCNPGTNTAVVNVAPGTIANETILTVNNTLSAAG